MNTLVRLKEPFVATYGAFARRNGLVVDPEKLESAVLYYYSVLIRKYPCFGFAGFPVTKEIAEDHVNLRWWTTFVRDSLVASCSVGNGRPSDVEEISLATARSLGAVQH